MSGPRDSDALVGSAEPFGLAKLDDSFAPVSAVLCRSTPVRRPAGGEDMVAAEDRATDITSLVKALRLPDERRTDGACTADLVLAPWLALVDASGRWIRPGVPVNSCGKPRPEFRDALAELRTQRVSGRTLSTTLTDGAAAAGCEQTWADMVWAVGLTGGGKGTPDRTLAADDASVRVCVFQVPPEERGSGKPAGQFKSGGKLAPGEWAAVKKELAAAGTPAECTTPASRFAVLYAPDVELYVEADGCRRVLNDNALRTGSPKLLSIVF
ncbi:hypothetical protein GCM10010172_78050 [Paractinoplanes ferrugineus]|uniref:Uncharacterized protein n=1 Tax=Paractinoplanes ferrugineus TaxID=113564 RepID=A0A919J2S7_9ACTN|nr:hypothetical protein [Actinoplanes ferrugineus]GIE12878.1 hypothetical protein Afe05nite_47180 [Actinoplanes ferrugineus]